MANLKGCFSKGKDDWGAPRALYEKLDDFYRFDLDVCATAENSKCTHFITAEQNALAQPWGMVSRPRRCWMNPPFTLLRAFCQRAKDQVETGAALFVVALLPARTDTRAFHDFIYGRAEVTFLKGRLTFDGAPGPAPFPSMLCVWKRGLNG